MGRRNITTNHIENFKAYVNDCLSAGPFEVYETCLGAHGSFDHNNELRDANREAPARHNAA